MALLAIEERGVTALDVKNEQFIVWRQGTEVLRRPVHEIDHVELFGAVTLRASALAALMNEGVDTVFLTRRGSYIGRLVGKVSPYSERRSAQYRVLSDPAQALVCAKEVVATKLYNQYALLRSVRADRRAEHLRSAKVSLRALASRSVKASNLEVLRGFEGYGARVYFRALGEAFTNSEFQFNGRNRRPPRDPINACLSFGYTLLLNRVVSAVQRAGLDPYLGALHDPGRGKPSLALDLMEGYRPLLVDRAVLRLINRRQLTPEDFTHPDLDESTYEDADGGGEEGASRAPAVYLGPVGRPILIRELSQGWRELSQRTASTSRQSLREHLLRDAYGLAHYFEGTTEVLNLLRWT